MKKYNYGGLVKYVRKKRKLTIKQLSQLSHISERQIHRIEHSEVVEGNLNTIYSLSKVLNVNLIEYSTIFTDFSSLEEYEIYTELRYFIETKQYEKIDNILLNYSLTDLSNKDFCTFSQILYYAYAQQVKVKEKDFNKVLNLCYLALNTNAQEFNINRLKNYATSDLSCAIIGEIEGCNFVLNNIDASRLISANLLSIIEDTYYDTNLPVVSVSNIVFRTYINMLNNQADSLFLKDDFAGSLSLCTKALDKINTVNSSYYYNYLYFLICENYYNLGDIDKATDFLNKAIGACYANNDLYYLENEIKPKLKTQYTLLTLPTL